ncbi:MAG: prephenate dehydratase [Lachnospiraceae bacterium]|nr:prephenate dehydratase [Lachnospiraceae bacterium]
MAHLQELRKEIDRIDKEMVRLFEERMEICKNVAEYKIETGKKVFDRQREEEKIKAVQELTENEINRIGAGELFGQIMSVSRKLQYKLLAEHGILETPSFEPVDTLDKENATVVFQGIEGSYSYAAMKEYFGADVKNFHVKTFRNAMEAIAEGKADYAVLPIENSTAGGVSEIYDLLVEFNNYIVGEQIIEIKHCLLTVPGASKEDIKTIYSHPQSLMQSAGYLRQHEWKQVSMENNAFAAKKVADERDKTQAAVAGRYAGELYGLNILEEGINDSELNSTRFIIVSNQKKFLKNAGKVSVCFEIQHESGSLYKTLSHFIYNGINLCNIESRPIKEKNWEYRFFVDFEGNLEDSAVQNALGSLQEETRNLIIFGNY